MWICLVAASFGVLWGGCGGDASTRPDAADARPETHADTTPDDTASDVEAPEVHTVDDNFGVVESEGDPVCDQLDEGHCLFPFPSDHFRVDGGGPSRDGGPHLALAGAMPKRAGGAPIDHGAFERRDGWSPSTPIIFTLPRVSLPAPVYRAGQPFDIAASLDAASPTVILDTMTGERVPHWLELDHFARESGATIVFVRLAEPLAWGRRYVVAVRELRDVDGVVVPASPAFAALRDRTASQHLGTHARRARFEQEVFPVLETAGVPRATLQLAWDFTTATEDNTTGVVRAMADRLFEAIGEGGPSFTVAGVETPADDPHILRRVTLHVSVPSFLLAPDSRGVRRVRVGADGMPVAEGTETVVVEVQIPAAAMANPGTATAVQYGHGLFYSRAEGRQGWLRELAARERFVIFALDMEGMSEPDIGPWGAVISDDVGRFPDLVEWPMQGVMNHLAVQRLMRGGALATAPELTEGNTLLYDRAKLRYYGNSQGGTLGAVVSALSRDVDRAVLGVPGCSWSFLIHKSVGFAGFSDLLHLLIPDPYEFAAFLGLVQTGFDDVEPLGLAALLRPGAIPEKTVLLQVAKEDATVENQVSFHCGRAYGVQLLAPPVRSVWGLPSATSPSVANTLTEFDFGHPDNPDPFAPAPVANDTHEDLRRLRVAQDQLTRFFDTGEVVHLCDGVCDPD